ncbi:hypothetical protein K3M67_14200 [Sphingobium sp. V4]|uniref:hypothetical protein n=1 Tax=Sphingobium sp. V4 TaxID=3038927 RepID=UPI00255805C9|nr:hypothetical protein [Sphingobium sp. V4]WIW88095.1 hypothetical protein K3M67_14200 [Sphingobium sp. V4]
MAIPIVLLPFESLKRYSDVMVTAIQIADWAGTTPAATELPRLLRRLIHSVATTTQITMPAGESVSLPGFDGELHSEIGNAWVPAGHSFWELSCRADATTKANEDFSKRALATPAEVKADRIYVACTARRWAGKTRWRDEKIAEGSWKDVRAYDADDLEQWLEQCPAVALAFGEELGIAGPGVESLAAYLEKWGAQCKPKIMPDALLTGRVDQMAKLAGRIDQIHSGTARDPLAIKADSVEEAVAFAAAALIPHEQLSSQAVIVTSADGWRYVEKNIGITIAVAATPAVAEAPATRERLALLVPYASGDMARQFRGVAGRLNDAEMVLERALPEEFEKALQAIGLDENDTRRLSTLCGRSWSVFRRQHAINPAIRRPAWLDSPAADALAAVCLIGGWSTGKPGDAEIVARIAGRSYDDLEADLLALERLDDSPLLHIGSVWKAKSALELLAIFGERLTPAQLDRYFTELEAILSTPDPELELAEEDRFAAAIHGKVRPISGLLLDSLCDTLIKLAVRGPDIPALVAIDIQGRIGRLVHNLLRDCDRVRWLSLASLLPALAEASPHEFLGAVERGLDVPGSGPLAVFAETRSAGIGSRCWHAGILWALETLAWAPNRLRRVSLILARLTAVTIEGNWGNTPQSSLQDLYRSWFPQTAATVEQRIAAIDFLIEQVPEAAYRLLNSLTGPGPDSASHIARPKWRDDDAGAGYGATHLERHTMLVAAIDRQIEMSRGNAARIAKLVSKYTTLDAPRQERLMALIRECRTVGDQDKELIRSALRHKLYWHHNYDDKRDDPTFAEFLAPLEAAYADLEPDDLLIRHAWLFQSGWVELPTRTRGTELDAEGKQSAQAARAALGEIFEVLGWEGVLELATRHGEAWPLGAHLRHLGIAEQELERWIVEDAGQLHRGEIRTSLATSILCSVSPEQRHLALDRIFERARIAEHGSEWLVRLLLLCPHDPQIWARADSIGETEHFWSHCIGNLWLDDPAEMETALRKLVAHRRPVSALKACHIKFSGHDPELVMEMLEGVMKGFELDEAQVPQSYVFQHAIDYLEETGAIDEMRLVQLEFALIRALGFEEEQHAKSLYRVLMSRPEVFLELLCLIYKPRNGPPRDADDQQKGAAENAWHILHACERQPGTNPDGSIDGDLAIQFVEDARRLATEQDRLEVCDITLGQILAHAPNGADGFWPGDSARVLLERAPSEDMLRGFYTGSMNKRGVHSRAAYEGGDQERELAAHYRHHANGLEETHPQVGKALHELARSYDRHGAIEDLDAKLRIEGR